MLPVLSSRLNVPRFVRAWSSGGALLLPLLLVACGDGSVEGDLGVGKFRYLCLGAGDAACTEAGPSPEGLSLGVATGSELGLSFFQNDRDKPTGVIFPASLDRVEITARGFRALRPGAVAMLVRTSSGGGVLDFTHLTLVTPVKLVVAAPAEAKGQTLSLGFGAERTIEVFPVDAQGNKLAGSFVYGWTSDAPNVVAVKDASTTRRATIAAREAGTAHVQIVAQGIAEALDLTITVAGAGAGGSGGAGAGGSGGAGAGGSGGAGAGGSGGEGGGGDAGGGGTGGQGD